MEGTADWTDRERELLGALEEAAAHRERAESQSLVLEAITTGAPLREVLDLIRAALRVQADGDRDEREFAASIGVALSGDGADTPATLLQGADRAMYRAKGG